MTIETDLGRIASALERIAGHLEPQVVISDTATPVVAVVATAAPAVEPVAAPAAIPAAAPAPAEGGKKRGRPAGSTKKSGPAAPPPQTTTVTENEQSSVVDQSPSTEAAAQQESVPDDFLDEEPAAKPATLEDARAALIALRSAATAKYAAGGLNAAEAGAKANADAQALLKNTTGFDNMTSLKEKGDKDAFSQIVAAAAKALS